MTDEKSTTQQEKTARRTLLKIIVLGDSNVGKTALLRQYVENKFIENHQATIGADLHTKTITVDKNTVNMQIWDTAGQERYESLGAAYYRGADACIFVYDISSKTSFSRVDQWRQTFIRQAADINAPEYKFLLLGNKSDLKEDARQVSKDDGKRYAEQNQMLFFETSAKSGVNVEDAFMALVQEISTTTDTVFYSTEVGQKIKLVEQEMDAKNQNPCACTLI